MQFMKIVDLFGGRRVARIGAAWIFVHCSVYGIARAQCDGHWQTLGGGLNDSAMALTVWDPDGDGPLGPQLVAGGFFSNSAGQPAMRIARWDGSVWHPLGTGLNGGVTSLTTWDPDGDGPEKSLLVAAGHFSTAGGQPAPHIAAWDGESWRPFGTGMNNAVLALTSWDPDGSGGLPPQLIAGGWFVQAGSSQVNYIARWDGSAWHSMGGGMNSSVRALTSIPSGSSSGQSMHLLAGGMFVTAGGVAANSVARWDGSGWHAVGGGMNYTVNALTGQYVDEGEQQQYKLYAGGEFTVAGGSSALRIASWNGALWAGVGSGANGYVTSLAPWDPDGNGGATPELVAGGAFTSAGGFSTNRVMRWDGTSWQPLSTGMNQLVRAVVSWDPDGPGPEVARLIASGSFTNAGGTPASRIAMWVPSPILKISEEPSDTTGITGQTLTLQAAVPAGIQNVTVHWLRNGTTIVNGPSGASIGGGTVVGASGALPSPSNDEPITLVILNAQPSDSGLYAAVFTNPCGTVSSNAAAVGIFDPCPADFNGDDGVDDLDISAFFAAFEAGDPSANLNGDDAIDDLDITAFFAAFETGC